jgi:membrane associated rhomboid family serine protease
MREAPVGWQCARCVHDDSRRAPVTRWRPSGGGRLGSTRLTPVVVTLIVINVIVYFWEMASHAGYYVYKGVAFPCGNLAQCRFAMWPQAVHQGQWYRLLTAAFLHANIEHILFNMATLAIVGSPVEAELGKVRFTALYLVSALGGSVGSYLLSPQNELGVGASGAIFGLLGAYFVLARRRRWDISTIVALIVVNLIIGFATPTIDWRAHLGGLFTGGIVAIGLARSSDLRRVASRVVEVATGVGTTLGATAVLALLTFLPPGHVNL